MSSAEQHSLHEKNKEFYIQENYSTGTCIGKLVFFSLPRETTHVIYITQN
jgi:hypothetical protein